MKTKASYIRSRNSLQCGIGQRKNKKKCFESRKKIRYWYACIRNIQTSWGAWKMGILCFEYKEHMLTLSKETTPTEKRANNPEKNKNKVWIERREKKPYSDKKIENMLMNIWCFCAFFRSHFLAHKFSNQIVCIFAIAPTLLSAPYVFECIFCIECMTSDSRWRPYSPSGQKKIESSIRLCFLSLWL